MMKVLAESAQNINYYSSFNQGYRSYAPPSFQKEFGSVYMNFYIFYHTIRSSSCATLKGHEE